MSKIKFIATLTGDFKSSSKGKEIERVFDTESDLGMEEGEWELMSYEDKAKEVRLWAEDKIVIDWENVKD